MQLMLNDEVVDVQANAAADTNASVAQDANTDAQNQLNQAAGDGQWISIIMIVVMIAIMYFVMIRPQRKRQKEEQKMRNSLRVGDEITTIGGICGRILQVKDDSLVIETGADRSKMTIKKWAIQSCDTVHDAADVDDDDDDDDDI